MADAEERDSVVDVVWSGTTTGLLGALVDVHVLNTAVTE
jgi:hypothetical protein